MPDVHERIGDARPRDADDLPVPRGWPSALTVRDGNLAFDDCDLQRLATERGTPLWVISRSTIEENFTSFQSALQRRYPKCEVAYSIKAHNTAAVIRVLHRMGALMDCSAEYEFQIALLAGVPASDIILNGTGKSTEALRAAVTLGVRQVNIDSLEEVSRLDEVAGALGCRVACTVRVQLTYDRLLAADPSYEPTLRLVDKAGISLRSGQAMRAIEEVIRSPNLDFVGLHHHKVFSGYAGAEYSRDKEIMHHRECTSELCEVANEIRKTHGVDVGRLNVGGGFRATGDMLLSTTGHQDAQFHQLPTAEEYADAVFGTIERELESTEPPLVQFETGGHQIQNAVVLLTRVSESKQAEDVCTHTPRRFLFVDASMMMFVLRGMQAVVPGYPIVSVARPLEPAGPELVEIAGQSCMYDTIAEGVALPTSTEGDLLAVLSQGAYAETMSTQMNGFPRPEVVLVDQGRATVIKRRETIADVFSRNVIPTELWGPRSVPSPEAT